MEQKTLSLREVKHRKMLLVLPVLTLPFITLLFWTLGGGQMSIASTKPEEIRGFNFGLPEPKFKVDSDLDKMSYYDEAALDSIKLHEQIRNDPNYPGETYSNDLGLTENDGVPEPKNSGKSRNVLNTNSFKDPNEEKVYQKLRALQKAISQPPDANEQEQDLSEFERPETSNMVSDDVRSLEQMMSTMNQPQEPDPELKQLGGMLENILDIQHPARVEEKLRKSSVNQKDKEFSVDKEMNGDHVTLLQVSNQTYRSNQGAPKKQNSFFSLDENSTEDQLENAIKAVVHQTQTIVDGATIKLRLSDDIFINGIQIPKNSFLFGIASLKGERLVVKISNLTYRNSIFPISLSLYDMDGIAGIYIPGAIDRDVAKASADRSIQTLGVASLSDSWGAQAAGMGIEAAKSLLSKKVKLVKVVVKAGYQVLLYDEKQRNLK
ncbi:conjugative transposon protein TraM [Flavobacterium maritimum]|uniref:conjugative transposon protein TraM n=1 Tax=Flavobacterium maritimum TaxID=3149042 RepID=UPI0032B3A8AF